MNALTEHDGVFQLLGDPAQKLVTRPEVHEQSGGQEQSDNAVVFERFEDDSLVSIEEIIAREQAPVNETPFVENERPAPLSCRSASGPGAFAFVGLGLLLWRRKRLHR